MTQGFWQHPKTNRLKVKRLYLKKKNYSQLFLSVLFDLNIYIVQVWFTKAVQEPFQELGCFFFFNRVVPPAFLLQETTSI